MFRALFYPIIVKFYTENVRASMTSSMSDRIVHVKLDSNPLSGLYKFNSQLKY